jgi:hypothetical protein
LLRRIFGPKEKGATGTWIKLHNEEWHILQYSRIIIRMIKYDKGR